MPDPSSGLAAAPTALLIDDDSASRSVLGEIVRQKGFETRSAGSLKEARKELEARVPDVVLLDIHLPDGAGTELLPELAEEPWTEVVLITGNATVETAVMALRQGASDYLTKPVDIQQIERVLDRLLEKAELRSEIRHLREALRELGRFGSIVGTSPAMQQVYDLIDRVAPTDASVFVVGESGTGKELVAETIHRLSRRRDRPFLRLNCGAVSANLIESELFGHEKGSFTGASRQHAGYFERTSGGTILLDEIGEMPVDLQVKLLRVLESGTFLRVGGHREIEADVRVIAATNREPEKAVEEGKLREDLLYRLKVFPIELPPLREREGDVETLALHFLDQLNQEHDAKKRLSSQALDRLQRWYWPGNVRELKNVIRRAFILADERIGVECLPAEIWGEEPAQGPVVHVRVGSSLEEAERRIILATLEQLDDNKTRTAETLGVSLKTLYNRLKQYREED